MDSYSANIKVLEQTIDQIVKKEMVEHKPDPAKAAARQNSINYNLKLAKFSGGLEKAQRDMNASNPQTTPQAKQNYVYWKTQKALLESQKPLSSGG